MSESGEYGNECSSECQIGADDRECEFLMSIDIDYDVLSCCVLFE